MHDLLEHVRISPFYSVVWFLGGSVTLSPPSLFASLSSFTFLVEADLSSSSSLPPSLPPSSSSLFDLLLHSLCSTRTFTSSSFLLLKPTQREEPPLTTSTRWISIQSQLPPLPRLPPTTPPPTLLLSKDVNPSQLRLLFNFRTFSLLPQTLLSTPPSSLEESEQPLLEGKRPNRLSQDELRSSTLVREEWLLRPSGTLPLEARLPPPFGKASSSSPTLPRHLAFFPPSTRTDPSLLLHPRRASLLPSSSLRRPTLPPTRPTQLRSSLSPNKPRPTPPLLPPLTQLQEPVLPPFINTLPPSQLSPSLTQAAFLLLQDQVRRSSSARRQVARNRTSSRTDSSTISRSASATSKFETPSRTVFPKLKPRKSLDLSSVRSEEVARNGIDR